MSSGDVYVTGEGRNSFGRCGNSESRYVNCGLEVHVDETSQDSSRAGEIHYPTNADSMSVIENCLVADRKLNKKSQTLSEIVDKSRFEIRLDMKEISEVSINIDMIMLSFLTTSMFQVIRKMFRMRMYLK